MLSLVETFASTLAGLLETFVPPTSLRQDR